jgi:hypothetical protein
MKKYNIEGGIDFFAELYKSLDDDENNNKTDEDNNKCLITNQPLIDKFVEMKCGHKFNYIPLYYDVLNHKQKFNNMEGTATRLKQNEIRCPYCREKSTELLPYYENMVLPKVNGVNYIDVNYDSDTDSIPTNSYYKKCEYLTPNINFNVYSQNISEVYNKNLNLEDCKFIKCTFMGTQLSYGNTDDNYGDNKYYCWSHKKLVIKNYKKKISDKIKEDKKQIKLKEKEELQKAKKEEKQKEKEEKQKAKDELKKTTKTVKKTKLNIDENIIIGVSSVEEGVTEDVEPILLCQEILKSGNNKGNPCGNKIFENNLCKRHTKKINN